jgi:hypothetical protein
LERKEEGRKLKMKIKKRYLIFFAVLLLLLYFDPLSTGYSLTEESAIRNSFPNQGGEIVFEKKFDNNKVVVWDTGPESYVKLLRKELGIFYRVHAANAVSGITADNKMKFTWDATLKDDIYYDTLFAAVILDKKIVKVIVSNNGINNINDINLTLREVEENSTVYIEMDVINGYAAHYSYLHNSDVGGFLFRGLNSEGKVISIQ